MSNRDRYAALTIQGLLTPNEMKKLSESFPEKSVDDEDKIVRIVSNFELEDKESQLMREGYRHRQLAATIHEFRRKGDNSFRRFIIDPWLR